MDESVIRSCILFLSITTPDLAKVFPAVEQIVDSSRRKRAKYPEKSAMSVMIQETSKYLHLDKWQKIPQHPDRKFESTEYREVAEKIKRLRETSKVDELEAFLWLECAGVSLADAAEGLGLSEGTLKHRAYRGLKDWADGE